MNRRTYYWLQRPPVKWKRIADRYLERHPERIGEIREVCQELDWLAQRSAMLRAYLETRLGMDGTGAHPHGEAVSEAGKELVRVRKALGYTYPQRGVFTF